MKDAGREPGFSFIQNKECPYFPCHKNVPVDKFNCKFCYCPLYYVKDCGGNPKYLESGIKDCSDCTFNHGTGRSINRQIMKVNKDRLSVTGHIDDTGYTSFTPTHTQKQLKRVLDEYDKHNQDV